MFSSFHLSQSTYKCRSIYYIENPIKYFSSFSSHKTNSSDKGNQVSFHKRPLPENLIALSSTQGKILFREALEFGDMESYFPLAEQFITQSEPSYCSLSTLAMVLNALNYDPKKIWKGSWRWVSEEMFHCETKSICGHTLEKVQKQGLNFAEFESLAKCHGVKISSHRVCHNSEHVCGSIGLSKFRNNIIETSKNNDASKFIVANFSRKFLNQTGDGHFSPIAGYHRGKDMVLILDVARFKYPPYWVSTKDLWDAMAVQDVSTGLTRGYFVIAGWDQTIPASYVQYCTLDNH